MDDKSKEQKGERKEEKRNLGKEKYKKWNKMKRLFAQSTKIAL